MAESVKEEKKKLNYNAHGSSGVQHDQGVFSEEYLTDLRGVNKHFLFDKMKRSESSTKMLLSAVKNIVRGAKYDIEGDDEKQLELVKHLLIKKGLGKGSFKDLVGDILTMIEHGFAVFEKVHYNGQDKTVGAYTGLSLRFRSQKTIEEWHFNDEEKLSHLIQVDIKGDKRTIPGEFVVLFNIDAEGNNLEGVSMLRPCYGPYLRKELKLKIEAVGTEKAAIPAPLAKFIDEPDADDLETLKKILDDYTSNRAKYIILPPGIDVDLQPNTFDSTKIQASITAEEQRMTKAFLANFLELGMGNSSGSFALSSNQSEFFTKSIEYILDQILEILNNVIEEIIMLNFPNASEFPQIIASGVSEKAGEEFSKILLNLKNAGILVPDEKLEEAVRKRYNLPDADLETSRKEGDSIQEPEPSKEDEKLSYKHKTYDFANFKKDKISRTIKMEKEILFGVMQKGLSETADVLISDLLKAFDKKSDRTKIDAIDSVEVKSNKYKKILSEALFDISLKGINLANEEIKAKLKFDDQDEKNIKKRVSAQARLLAQTQMADIEKAVYFSFMSGVELGKTRDRLEFEMLEAKEKVIGANSVRVAAANTAAQMINEARRKHFFREEVFEQIESFTFYNPDPQSGICKSLQGRTVKANHPDLEQYWTPLHHNCDSTWLPNLKGDKNPEIDSSGPTPDPQYLKEKTL